MRLEQMGLVERVIVIPTKYKPMPVFDGLSILMGRKDKENIELQIEAAKLCENFKRNDSSQVAENQNMQYIMIPEGEALLIKLKKIFENAEKTVSIQFPQKMLLPLFLNDETVERTVKRNVEVKVITEKNPTFKLPKSILELTRKHPFEIRYNGNSSFVPFGICDRKEALLPISSNPFGFMSPAVWSNNPNFVEFAQNYFDAEWFAASQMPAQFDNLFSEVVGAFSYNQIIMEPDGDPTSYVLLKANDAFLKIFNLTEKDFGKKTHWPFPGAEKEPALTQVLGQIASGETTRLEYDLSYLDHEYSLLVFSPQKGYFTLVIKKFA